MGAVVVSLRYYTCAMPGDERKLVTVLFADVDYGHRLTELRLAALAEADSRSLAENLLRVSDLPDAIRQTILSRAEGNPFFLEEIIRALIEQGVLRREGERWVVGEDPKQWPIPTTLRGVLTARIDRLPGPAKAVLQHASVVGRLFEYRTVAAIGLGGHLKTGQSWTGQNRPVGHEPQA